MTLTAITLDLAGIKSVFWYSDDFTTLLSRINGKLQPFTFAILPYNDSIGREQVIELIKEKIRQTN
mgnify:CR=1 FL=1